MSSLSIPEALFQAAGLTALPLVSWNMFYLVKYLILADFTWIYHADCMGNFRTYRSWTRCIEYNVCKSFIRAVLCFYIVVDFHHTVGHKVFVWRSSEFWFLLLYFIEKIIEFFLTLLFSLYSTNQWIWRSWWRRRIWLRGGIPSKGMFLLFLQAVHGKL